MIIIPVLVGIGVGAYCYAKYKGLVVTKLQSIEAAAKAHLAVGEAELKNLEGKVVSAITTGIAADFAKLRAAIAAQISKL